MRKTTGLVIATLFGALLPLKGQEVRGTILGRVTDQTNAVMVGARVEVTNTATGVRSASVTNESGDYLFPFLIPGPYTLMVESPGFKTFTRAGLNIRVNDRITIDVRMELGQAAESVQVVAETPILDTSTSSMGQVIDSKTILDLPLKDGMVIIMATFSPGVQFLPQRTGYTRPFDVGTPSQLSIDGTRTGSNEFMMDGAPNMQRNGVAYSPPPGVVEEFKVQTATFDASYGFMAGGALSMSLKSGANDLHGQTYYFLQNPALNANTFFQNRMGLDKSTFRLHRWGASASGPIHLPKLYSGRNKTFWMYGYEGIWSFDPTPYTVAAVPTPAQRTGDFSQLLAAGAQYQIYDPYSITPAPGGRFSRQPVPGNVIPANLINPVARKIAALWDLPNQTGTRDGVNNYRKAKNALDIYYNHIVRIDHNVSAKQRFFARGNVTEMDRDENIRHNGAWGNKFLRWNRGLAFDHVYVFSPQFFLNTRYSFTRFIEGTPPLQGGWDLAGMGFSSTFINQINQVDPRGLKLPRIEVSGYHNLAEQDIDRRHDDIHDVAANLTTMVHSHTMRYGVGYRVRRENNFNLDQSSGRFDFGTTWTRGPLDTSPSAPMGQGMASLLYGLPTGGYFPIRDSYAEQDTTWALYFQDDWKVSRKLTLSAGLRYELFSPLTERFNRSVRGFDAATPSPIEVAARANYAKDPIPEVPVGQFQVRGGLTFAAAGGLPRTLWRTDKANLMPRLGFAYSITPKTVFRGGYGVFYEPIGIVNAHVNQTGFHRNTDFLASLDNGQTYVANLTNPFPGGFERPLAAAGGLATNLGQGVSFFDEGTGHPYMQRWQFAIQRELPQTSVLEISYVGNRGTRQRIGRQYDPVPREYLSTSPVRDQRTIDFLNAAVTNPFYPLLPKTSLAGTNVSRSQLLRPYPQFTGVSADTNQGYSWYHSMQVRFEKRFARGLSSSLSYTWSKLMEARQYLNDTDPTPREVISDQDRTQRLVATWIYELPFGRSRRWGSAMKPALSGIISGWQLQGIYGWQSGEALGFGNAIFNGNLKDIPLPRGQRTIDRWFNVDAGFERDSRRQLGANIRTLCMRFSGIRGDALDNWDLSLIKNTQIRESVQLQFRAEAINALNHAQFMPPETSPTSTAFGRVTDERAWPRVVQFGLKVLF
ncbi:MAG: TonB-dependent receptor [Acidobacteriota bacterium]